MRLILGSLVRCTDGDAGELADVVVDPRVRRVTHLVVAPEHKPDQARLVPIARVQGRSGTDGVQLSASRDEVGACEIVHQTEYLRLGERPVVGPDRDIGIDEVYMTPTVGGAGGLGMAPVDEDPHAFVGYDRVPKGEIELRRSSIVTGADGKLVGHLDGVVVGEGEQITDLLVRHGHLWGRHETAIPASAIATLESDAIGLKLSAHDAGQLPSVRAHAPGT